ncbi:MAG TPA: endonuclease/exonuclease/phosphatase family protein [Pirellulaceae bacterium]|nr:endonuclease/exonuclease/phosphatase family protein [Pirellulaceae bacterium]HMO90820.1 endonuclease/exonuclease/phosphatase family protein [Pirellulaceae bacterium]HMP68071.1 endonuclease/exonuclease/phosphatase family protein [Pirellulaceae bacterium]
MFKKGKRSLVAAFLLWVFAMLGVDFFDVGSLLQQQWPIQINGETTPTGSWGFPNSLPTTNQPQTTPTQVTVEFQRTQNLIAIGSFNIQVFGDSKMSKPEVVAILADIVRQFDVLAIQEIRTTNQNHIADFVAFINQRYGTRYNYVIGPRQGRTNSKEQYCFIFDTDRIELTHPGYIVPDPQDSMHREPMVSIFRTRVNNGYQPFSFILANVHTDPDEVTGELVALNSFYDQLRQYHPYEDDIILLGDFNAPPNKFGPMGSRPEIAFAVPPHRPTNTRGSRNLDNIVFDRLRTTEFVGGGVFDMIHSYNLTMEQALQVSDHVPVWGLFTINERTNVVQNVSSGNFAVDSR